MEFSILYQLQGIHSPWLDRLMVVLTFLGDKGCFWIVLGGALSCHRRTRDWGIAVLLSLAAGFLVGNCLLKELVGRSRPCWIDPGVGTLVAVPKDFSFPSGHTLAGFEAAVSIFLYDRRWGLAAGILAALIGFSRLYLFVHFPSDVLAGAVLGTLIALAVHRLVRLRQHREQDRSIQKAG